MYNYPEAIIMDQRWNIIYASVYKGIFIDPIDKSKRHLDYSSVLLANQVA